MSWKKLTEEEKLSLAQRHANGENLDSEASRLGIPAESFYRRIREYKNNLIVQIAAKESNLPFRQLVTPVVHDDFIVQATDEAIIISDLEMPDTDPEMLEAAFLLGVSRGIRTLIIVGDFNAWDQAFLTTHPTISNNQMDVSDNIRRSNKLIEVMLMWFTEIFITSGNHDERVAKATFGEMNHESLFSKYGDRVKFSRFRYMWLKTSRGYAYLCHPTNYSEDSAKLAAQIYDKMVSPDGSKPYAIVMAHTHQPQFRKSRDNLCECYALGCMRDVKRTEYVMQSSNKFAQWGQSVLVLQDGYFEHYERESTNWARVLGEYGVKARIAQ